ncbi:MAG: 3-methyl-2-oxobutanoate hydroxymethyltransferase [Eubacterium sp.]|nr:3-methyl-2-oxobutanoate hydroxymethyltransferase [Eubacterium sp.]
MAEEELGFNCAAFERTRKTVWHLQQMKNKGQKITMVGTAFMSPFFTMWCEYAGVDLVRYIAPGENSRERAANMESWTRQQRKMAPNICLNAVLESCQYSDKYKALDVAATLLQEGADCVLPMGATNELVEYLADNHVAVFGHVGCLSGWQTTRIGGYKRVGKTAEDAMKIYRQAYEYQESGMVGMTIEMTSREVTDAIAKKLRIPVIEIVGGSAADGSEMVILDLLGMVPQEGMAKHSKAYADLMHSCMGAFKAFGDEVRGGQYPQEKHGWGMDQRELDKFLNEMEKQ